MRKVLSWSKAGILLAAAVARLEAAWGTPQNDVRGSPALTRKPVFLAYPLEVSHEVRRYAPAGLRAAADRLARPLLFSGIGDVPAYPFMQIERRRERHVQARARHRLLSPQRALAEWGEKSEPSEGMCTRTTLARIGIPETRSCGGVRLAWKDPLSLSVSFGLRCEAKESPWNSN